MRIKIDKEEKLPPMDWRLFWKLDRQLYHQENIIPYELTNKGLFGKMHQILIEQLRTRT